MTLEEKLERLRMISMQEARANGNEMIATYKASLDQILEDHKETALRQAELTIKTETTNAKHQLNKAISTYQTELKREQNKCQIQLKNRLFLNVKILLDDYMQTQEYSILLMRYIQYAKDFASGATLNLYINISDTDKIKFLQDETGTSITVHDEDFIGGIRAILPERNILIDHSFSSALSEQYNNFLFSGGNANE